MCIRQEESGPVTYSAPSAMWRIWSSLPRSTGWQMPSALAFTARFGLVENFLILGVCYMVLIGASALYLKAPEQPEGKGAVTKRLRGATAAEAMRTWQFGALWWVFFVNITCGICVRFNAHARNESAKEIVNAGFRFVFKLVCIHLKRTSDQIRSQERYPQSTENRWPGQV